MAQVSSSAKINYKQIRLKVEEKEKEVKERITELLVWFGKDIIDNNLSKRRTQESKEEKDADGNDLPKEKTPEKSGIWNDGAIWVTDKRGYEKSLLSILKWRSYVETRGKDKILLMFRNDAINTRKGGNNTRYAKYLVGGDGLYKAKGQGLTEINWLHFKGHLQAKIKEVIKTGQWKEDLDGR